MTKFSLVLGMLYTVCLPVWGQTLLSTKSASITFFSSTPLEDIEGKSISAAAALNRSTGELVVKVRNTSFKFEKKLMQEHFNENYIESHKYPVSEFKGKIQDTSVLSINGKHTVTARGTLQVHGVSKSYEVKVDLQVDDSAIHAQTEFPIKVADHKIKIPGILGKNIAETIKTTIVASLVP